MCTKTYAIAYARRRNMHALINSIPAQQIKQRGISAVDDLLCEGPVHVIMRNEPRYVVMGEK